MKAVLLGRFAALLAAAAIVLPAASCGTSPTEWCDQFRQHMSAMLQRCGIAASVEVFYPDGTPASCEDVNAVRDPAALEEQCFPWTETASCDMAALTEDGWDPSCQAQFEYRRAM